MPITKFAGVTNSVQSLPDRPTQTDGFTPALIKIRFDQFSIDSKAWFNDVMSVEVDALLLSANTNATNALNGVALAQTGAILDNSLTELKMANEMKKDITGGITAYNTFLAQLQLKADAAGLGSAAFTASTNYATAAQGVLATNAATQTQLGTKANETDNTRSTTSKTVTGAINELFTNANNGKQNWVDVIGIPLVNTDTFITLKSKTQAVKNTMASNLTAKGQSSVGTESLTSLVDKVALVNTGKKWASGSYAVPANGDIVVSGLAFKPSIVLFIYDNSYYGFCYEAALIDGYITFATPTSYFRFFDTIYKTTPDGFRFYLQDTPALTYNWIAIE